MLEQIRFKLKNKMIIEVNEDGFTLYQADGKTWIIDGTNLADCGEITADTKFFSKSIQSKILNTNTLQGKTNAK